MICLKTIFNPHTLICWHALTLYILFAYFPYFKKKYIIRLMRSPCSLCIALLTFLNALTNLYATWHEYHSIPPISLCVCMCIPLSLLGKGSIKTLPRWRIPMQQQKNCWTRHFLCGPYSIKGKQSISSSRNFLLSLQRITKTDRLTVSRNVTLTVTD
jgi:hypothetical protein